ncbi:MAG: hypothetical protein PHX21_01335 [bacterium]|nr:hypothetical protein [bacterium]
MTYKLKILIVSIIIFSGTNTFADSSSFSVNSPITNTQLPNTLITNSVCNFSPSIGLKASDLVIADAWKGNYLFLAESSEGENPVIKNDEYLGCCLGGCTFGKLNPRIKKPKNSWVITEPLGGIAGGAFGMLIFGGLGVVITGFEGYDVVGLYGLIFGYIIGSPYGIWATGKLIEKEKGSLNRTMLGGMLGGLGAMIICNSNVDGVIKTGSILALPFAGGLIGYRMSLK